MKEKSLYPSIQTCFTCSGKVEEKTAAENSNASVKYPPTFYSQCTDCDSKDGIEPRSYDADIEIQASHKGKNLTQTEYSDANMECSICLEVLEAGDKLSWSRDFKCEHIYHQRCLVPWLMTHDECPNCRTKIIDDYCHADTMGESTDITIYPFFLLVDNVNSNNHENLGGDNFFRKLKRFVRQSISDFQPPQRVIRIDNEHDETMIPQEYLMDF